MGFLSPVKPAYRQIDCPLHSGMKQLFRFKTGSGYANLTGFNCIAEVWNKSRTAKYITPIVTWINRAIVDEVNDFHVMVEIPEGSMTAAMTDAIWSLKLISTDGQETFIEQGPLRPYQDWIDAP
jgi:hypothetical protein